MAKSLSNKSRSGAKTITKEGKYGTLYYYAIVYTDAIDRDGFGEAVFHTWAYDSDHAIDNFIEGNDGDSWEIVRWARLTEAPFHRQTWHKV